MNKKINTNISFLRFIFCIAVLLYHLGLLQGGYLAVCSFFVMTGFFFSISFYKNNSITSFYIKRLKKIYLPLVIVVFSTISILSILKINIFNFKSEITSVLLGYNNYFQINANFDYFAKNINSPFIHLWYISILLQIELVFPFVFTIIKKIGNKINKNLPTIIMFLISIIGVVYFYINSTKGNIMITYYGTLSRFFSFSFGVFGGLVYINSININKHKKTYIQHLFIYTLLLIIMFVTIKSSSKLFALSMILTTLMTVKLLLISSKLYTRGKTINKRFINYISSISYEIYLVQYPIIFIFSNINIPIYLKIALIIILTIVISALIHLIYSKKRYSIPIKFILLILILFGGFKYIAMKDNTKEINKLKEELNESAKIMEQKQKEYKEKSIKEKTQWNEYIKSLSNEDEIYEYVTNLKIVGVGDSVMLDSIPKLYETFPNGYFDAKVSRSTCASYEVLKSIKDSIGDFDAVIFNLGTNDTPNRKCKDNLMSLVGDKPVFWLNATHPDDDTSNSELEKYANEFDNIHILDWVEAISKHKEYLYSDETHLKPEALDYYVDFIKNSIYNQYLEDYKVKIQYEINKHKEEEKNKISFYGNELLINIYKKLQKEFESANYEANKKMNYDKLINLLSESIKNDTLSNKLVFIFDKNSNITKDDYQKIISKCKNKDIYIITTTNISLKGATIINITNKKYFLEDKIHLNKEGNQLLINKIINALK